MCDATGITLAVLGGLSTTANVAAQNRNANAQEDTIEAQGRQRTKEIEAAANKQAGERVKAARAERARIRTAAGEAGVSGQSFEAQLRDSLFQQNLDVGDIGLQAEFNLLGLEAAQNSALASINKVGALEGGLQIASSATSGYLAGLQFQNARPNLGGGTSSSVPSGSLTNFDPAASRGLS